MNSSNTGTDLLGAVIANLNNLILVGIFLARLLRYWLGVLFLLSIFPIAWMLYKSFSANTGTLYFIQLSLMMAFLIVEFILDYYLKIDFRHNRNILIPYVTLFYASLGGMIGVAGRCGKTWTIITVITFLSVTIISLIMHFKLER